VHRQPPPNFFAEALPPQKIGTVLSCFSTSYTIIQSNNLIGNNHLYGMRISPILLNPPSSPVGSDSASTRTGKSSASSGSQSREYTVLRKWDDCLWFQHVLEEEYTSQAREKRRHLAQGKGLLKNGVYVRSDLASSFASLPFGPDPSTITTNIHDIIPKLTKKNTLFRVSQAIVEQRYKEFTALIETLFRDDLPILVKELRDSDSFRNFFAYWSFDSDLEHKQGRGKSSSVPQSSPRSLRFSASTFIQPQTPPPGDLKSIAKHDPNVEASSSHIGHPSPKRPDESYTDNEQERQSPRKLRLSIPSVLNPTLGADTYLSQISPDHDTDRRWAVRPNNRSHNSRLLSIPTSPTILENVMEFPVTPTELSFDEGSSVLRLSTLLEDAELIVSSSKVDTTVIDRGVPSDDTLSDITSDTDTASSSRCLSRFTISSQSSLQTPVSGLSSRPLSTLSQCTISSDLTEQSRPNSSALPHSYWFADDISSYTYRNSTASMASVMTGTSADRILPHNVSNASSLPSELPQQADSTSSLSPSGQASLVYEGFTSLDPDLRGASILIPSLASPSLLTSDHIKIQEITFPSIRKAASGLTALSTLLTIFQTKSNLQNCSAIYPLVRFNRRGHRRREALPRTYLPLKSS
jgi:hypothetical protein